MIRDNVVTGNTGSISIDADERWQYETHDEKSALIEKLRALPRTEGMVNGAELDAVLNAAIETPTESEK